MAEEISSVSRSSKIAESRRLTGEGKKRCKKCGEIKPRDEQYFRFYEQTMNGKTYSKVHPICHQCASTDLSEKFNKTRQLSETGEKECVKCKQVKPLTQQNFASSLVINRGKEYLKWETTCNDCRSDNGKRLLETRRLAKEGKKRCVVCEEVKDLESNFRSRHRKHRGKIITHYESKCNACLETNHSKRLMETRALAKEGKKRCSKCKVIKELNEQNFYRKKNDNTCSPHCRDCASSRKVVKTRELYLTGKIRCNKCFEEFPATSEHFYKNAKTQTGFFVTCKLCTKKRNSPEQYQKEILLKHGFKQCASCAQVKTLKKFYKNKAYFAGVDRICMDCNLKRQKNKREANYEEKIEKERDYRRRNPHIYNANKQDKARSFPKWLGEAERQAVRELYQEANLLSTLTGTPHEVDHIVPIKHEKVCGLHVAWNLQVVTRTANRRKSGRFEV